MVQRCGLSDMSTYGKFRISGPDAVAWLDHIGSAKCPEKPGRVAVLLLRNNRGGIVGDITIEGAGGGTLHCVGATLDVALYQRWMQDHVGAFAIRIENMTNRFAAVGVAGPKPRPRRGSSR
ncbi:MAG: hypothetical protein ACOH2H_13365 [Cypionkella sp.]